MLRDVHSEYGAAVAVLSCALVLSGCYTSSTISLAQAARFSSNGRALTDDGATVALKDVESIEPLPPKGSTYYLDDETLGSLSDRKGGRSMRVNVEWPNEVRVGDVVHLSGPRRAVELPRGDVRVLRVRRLDTGATVGVGIGVAVGLAALFGAVFAIGKAETSGGAGSSRPIISIAATRPSWVF